MSARESSRWRAARLSCGHTVDRALPLRRVSLRCRQLLRVEVRISRELGIRHGRARVRRRGQV
eukprot:4024793-Prymnesium_polylepis.1